MSSVTGLARLAGRILSFAHMGDFNPVIEKKTTPERWTAYPKDPGRKVSISRLS